MTRTTINNYYFSTRSLEKDTKRQPEQLRLCNDLYASQLKTANNTRQLAQSQKTMLSNVEKQNESLLKLLELSKLGLRRLNSDNGNFTTWLNNLGREMMTTSETEEQKKTREKAEKNAELERRLGNPGKFGWLSSILKKTTGRT